MAGRTFADWARVGGFANLRDTASVARVSASIFRASALIGSTLSGLVSALPGVAASDLVYATQTACSDDAGCVVATMCPGPAATCLGSLLGASWDGPSDGVSGLFSSTDGGATSVGGWRFVPGTTPCAITRGGAPQAGITTDLYGVTRSTTSPTLGAAENPDASACTP